MWVILNDAFLSIVASDKDPAVFSVRARAKGDIQRVFGPAAKVIMLDARDYAFRAFIPRDVVAAALADQVARIDYTNFKNSVKEKDRHDTYFRVWQAMADFQAARGHGAPYQTTRTGKGRQWATPRRRSPMEHVFLLDPADDGPYNFYRDLTADDEPWDTPPPRGFHGMTQSQFEELERQASEIDFVKGHVHPLDQEKKPKRRRGRNRRGR